MHLLHLLPAFFFLLSLALSSIPASIILRHHWDLQSISPSFLCLSTLCSLFLHVPAYVCFTANYYHSLQTPSPPLYLSYFIILIGKTNTQIKSISNHIHTCPYDTEENTGKIDNCTAWSCVKFMTMHFIWVLMLPGSRTVFPEPACLVSCVPISHCLLLIPMAPPYLSSWPVAMKMEVNRSISIVSPHLWMDTPSPTPHCLPALTSCALLRSVLCTRPFMSTQGLHQQFSPLSWMMSFSLATGLPSHQHTNLLCNLKKTSVSPLPERDVGTFWIQFLPPSPNPTPTPVLSGTHLDFSSEPLFSRCPYIVQYITRCPHLTQPVVSMWTGGHSLWHILSHLLADTMLGLPPISLAASQSPLLVPSHHLNVLIGIPKASQSLSLSSNHICCLVGLGSLMV